MNAKKKNPSFFIFLFSLFISLTYISLSVPIVKCNYPAGFACYAGNVHHNITIDGMNTNNEWTYIQSNLIIFDFDDNIALGHIQFAWDLEYLYVLAYILDDNETSDRGFFIFFDEANNGTLDNLEDVRGLFSNNTKFNKHINETGNLELDANEASYHAKYNFTPLMNYHWFEFAIPFSDIGNDLNITPSIGKTIGIDLEYWNGTHYDDFPDLGRHTVVWQNQMHYGDLILYGILFYYDFTGLFNNLMIVTIVIVILVSIVVILQIYTMKKKQKIKDNQLKAIKTNKEANNSANLA